jgi:glycosyltransferase involved in cell wall biosynthesis
MQSLPIGHSPDDAAVAGAEQRGAPASRIRILHAAVNLDQGGLERVVSDLVRHSDSSRFEHHLLCLNYIGHYGAQLADRATLHLAKPMSRFSNLHPKGLIEMIRNIAPDVVHSHSGAWYKVSMAARRAGVRRILHTEHGRSRPDPLSHRIFDGIGARRTDVVVAVSNKLGKELQERLLVPADRIVVVPNGIEADLFRPRPDPGTIRRELGIAENAPVIGSIGRFYPIKGYDVVLRAFARLLQGWTSTPRPALILAGDGWLREELEQTATELGVAGDTHFVGWRDDTNDLLATFTIFTLGSRSEGTSMSLLEAMSSGVCPVVTNVGGNAAVMGEALAHRLVPSENPDALAASWRDAIADAPRRERDIAAGRSRVLEKFTTRVMIQAYETLYRGGALARLSG